METPKPDRRGALPQQPVDAARAAARSGESEWAHELTRGAEPEPQPEPALAAPPVAVLFDDGELADVAELLDAAGVQVERIAARDAWRSPELAQRCRLFVAPAFLALSPELPRGWDRAGVTGIVVAPAGSQTLGTAMRRLGFDYLVRRPVHPEALRLLLLQAVYTGRNRRVTPRFACGAEVAWRIGLHRGRGTLTEISSKGCRLLVHEAVEIGARVHIHLDERDAGGRALTLRGRIVRRDRGTSRASGHGASMAVAFEGLSGRVEQRLAELLAERAGGPASVARREGEEPAGEKPEDAPPAPRTLSLSETSTPRPRAPEPGQATLRLERRRGTRGLLQREVVALDAEGGRVVHTLMGTDLSVKGVRVEPHHGLRVGERLRIALYDASADAPVIAPAEVARDDGDRGWMLLFDRLEASVAARIEALVASLPDVESLEPEGSARRVYVGELLLGAELPKTSR